MARQLTPREEDVLRAMIQNADTVGRARIPEGLRDALLEKVPATRVWGTCGCGTCPSIDFAEDLYPAREVKSQFVLEAQANGAGLLLFIEDGELIYLELYPLGDDSPFAEFPPVSEIRF